MIWTRLAAHLPQDVLARARALLVVEAAFAQVGVSLTGGAALTGFALLLGATSFDIGLMASLPALAALAQLATSYFTQKLGGWLRDNYQVLFLASGVARLATVGLTGLFREQSPDAE